MAEYRRKKGTDTWHWCRNCTGDPKADYDKRDTRPAYDLCDQCKAKEDAGTCQK